MLVVCCFCSSFSGKGQSSGNTALESKPIEPTIPVSFQARRDYDGNQSHQPNYVPNVCIFMDLASFDWI